ncbi:hypothetical protein CUMW_032600 [Citrus unshiu]|nr:hypothetical protein CUMW_032600 [Citrus unshiu]GAY37896.1 hypothetical protein CUMW_032600 [Citrus unshiu]GAY37897.1 hypothetical protein CUMW_032600 [Citrus unshiu]
MKAPGAHMDDWLVKISYMQSLLSAFREGAPIYGFGLADPCGQIQLLVQPPGLSVQWLIPLKLTNCKSATD